MQTIRNKLLTFAESTENLQTANEAQFVLARLRCFAEGITSHGWKFSLDSVKKASFSLLGKPILWSYSVWEDDAKGHEPDEIACGFIPDNEELADIQYVYDEDYDKTFVEVNCYIWAVYADKMVEILKRTDGVKDVSSELWIIGQDEKDEYNVTEYVYTGVTILGEIINPAVKGAEIRVVKFSEEYNQAKAEFVKILNSEEGDTSMDNEKIQELDNATEVTTTTVRVSEYTDKYDDDGKWVGGKDECHTVSETTVEEVPDSAQMSDPVASNNECGKEEDNADCIEDDNAEGCGKEDNAGDCIEDKNSETPDYEGLYNSTKEQLDILSAELNELKGNYEALEIKCADLEEYKTNKEAEEMTKAVNCAIAEVADCFSADEIEAWKAKAVECSNIDAFKNELKACAFDKQKTAKSSIRNPIPMGFANTRDDDAKTSLWQRVANAINNK